MILKKFFNLPSTEKLLFLEAFAVLGWMRASILILPFKQITKPLEQMGRIAIIPPVKRTQQTHARLVGQAINKAAKFTPWQSTCLAQAMTTYKMLTRHHIPGVFYLGVIHDKNKGTKKKIKAHAWSQCGDIILTGDENHESFTIISTFSWPSN